MIVQKFKKCSIILAVAIFILLPTNVQATGASVENLVVNVLGTAGGTLAAGTTQTVSATITSTAQPFVPFTATVWWQITGASVGTQLLNAAPQTITISSPNTTITNQIQVASTETAASLTLQAIVFVGDFARTGSTVLNITGNHNTGTIIDSLIVNVLGTAGATLTAGTTQTVSATITSTAQPFVPFVATVLWQITGATGGTQLVTTVPQTITIDSANTTILNQIQVASTETAANLILQATIIVGDFSRTSSTILNILGNQPTGNVLLEHTIGGVPLHLTNHHFGNVSAGYAPIAPLQVAVLNQAPINTGTLTVQLVGADMNAFVLSGGVGNDSLRTVDGIPALTRHGNVFAIAPRFGLPNRAVPYTAAVVVTGNMQGQPIHQSFNVSFAVGTTVTPVPPIGTFTLTVTSTAGGMVSFGTLAYSPVVSGNFAPGERISINARPNNNFFFDSWTNATGQVMQPWSDRTVFIMPSNNVTVTANFLFGIIDTNPWQPAPVPNVSATLPPLPPPPQLPPEPPVLQPLPVAPLPTPQPEPLPIVMTPLTVNLNGQPMNFTDQSAVMVQGVSLLPVGELFDRLGYTIEWDPDLLQATLNRFHITITLTANSRNFTVNNINHTLPVPAILINGRLMVPFVELIEAIGGRTNRDANNIVNIFLTR
ncbi:MAG: stalk domain-containing protein [Defluviitaleaceae bacterium]|nr:stalk domain-containing protein [Defluviitaleaceae bacterium]